LQIKECLIDLEKAEEIVAQELAVTARWANTEIRDQSQSERLDATSINGLMSRGMTPTISTKEDSPALVACGRIFAS
jgi:hypothetical protein